MQDWFSTINYLMIEANSQCNLSCASCTREKLVAEGLRNPAVMDEEKLIFLLEQLKDCPINTIKFEGLSEPFLHPKFSNLCEIMMRYFPSAHLIVITNLQYRIQNVDFSRVIDLCGSLYISIDGTNEIYEKLRAGAKWSVALKNLAFIKESLSSEQRKKIFINVTVSEDNYLELPKIYALKDEFSLGGVRINLIQNWEEEKVSEHHFSPEMMNFLKDHVDDIKGARDWDYKNCFWPFNGLIIDVEGRVRQCILNTTQKALANAFETPLKSIFNENPALLKIRETLNQNMAPDSCKTCDYKNLSAPLNGLLGTKDQFARKKVTPN